METLKYNYGETPEEVIRERHNRFRNDETFERQYNAWMEWARDIIDDDLLTVLDALAKVAGPKPINPSGVENDARIPANESRNLRISILAALGIDESEGGE